MCMVKLGLHDILRGQLPVHAYLVILPLSLLFHLTTNSYTTPSNILHPVSK